ncbi:MAG: hypothetical protein K8S23_16755 [Candidatus Cloacimonetes bacterium]|nr:hypothetical protein [Candidatus Cloacimonadota bacterium]
MKNISNYIAEETRGKSYKSHKYCLDNFEIPSEQYDKDQKITVKKIGETAPIQITKNLIEDAKRIQLISKPLFKYFLDGSRKTYKVDDIAYNKRVYPIMAGQIGVGCCERKENKELVRKIIEHTKVIVLPDCADKDGRELYFNNLVLKINKLQMLKKLNIQFNKILSYHDRDLQEGEKYENLGVAKIQNEMMDNEKKTVALLTKENFLNEDTYLIKDGSLEYQKMKTGNYKDLSKIKSNYRRVVGVSKSFNPERCIDNRGKSNAKIIAELKLYHRTPAYMFESSRASNVRFAIWYLRIRDIKYTVSPFDGILKVEKILVTNAEQEFGLETEEVDLISANLINERNPVCYGKDSRWANHLYPVYLTETYIKSGYLSNEFFINLF